jgi:hypothetical protein
MAIRLNVIIVHSPPPLAGAQQLAESLVGELIGRPGIDVALVSSLDGISADSTDALTLESISGDVAVLDWRSPADLMHALAALQFIGSRAPHANDPSSDEPPAGTRKIYAFDLQTQVDAKQLCSDLQALLASRRVQTFTIGVSDAGLGVSDAGLGVSDAGLGVSDAGFEQATKQPHTIGSAVHQWGSQASSETAPTDHSGSQADSATRSAGASRVTSPAASPTPNDRAIDLDALVDQLDLLDP